jgi:hypothetical protein
VSSATANSDRNENYENIYGVANTRKQEKQPERLLRAYCV